MSSLAFLSFLSSYASGKQLADSLIKYIIHINIYKPRNWCLNKHSPTYANSFVLDVKSHLHCLESRPSARWHFDTNMLPFFHWWARCSGRSFVLGRTGGQRWSPGRSWAKHSSRCPDERGKVVSLRVTEKTYNLGPTLMPMWRHFTKPLLTFLQGF